MTFVWAYMDGYRSAADFSTSSRDRRSTVRHGIVNEPSSDPITPFPFLTTRLLAPD
ncbi:hypothetical protein C7S17_0787 [Burkholderia thailandensis]|nr:hypothetical protein [Burkholderia thailandensis]